MGFYIERLPSGEQLNHEDKADQLLAIPGSQQLHPPPDKWQEDLVCVVENDHWDAAAYVYSQRELERFKPRSDDPRRRSWLIVPGAAALTGFAMLSEEDQRDLRELDG